ncbi:fimbria/pilus chaperone family protein [Pseudomonas sp. NPDC089996]|uniref:fimbria/pilus chaperone family protein n=1 Tax=Pseudomonas sp. NPDC089996 TaxID=3364474 RepID=UPI003827CBC2
MKRFWLLPLFSCFLAPALADGMIPETSVVIVNEADGEASIRVRNDDSRVALLVASIEDIPEDDEPLLFLSQPAWRVEAGREQVVRFILRTDVALATQRLKRVIFEGVPEGKGDGSSRVGVSIRQNLPVLIHPKGLALDRTPWTRLHWSLHGRELRVENPSPYVVRLAQELLLLPAQHVALLPRPYVLPGESLVVSRQLPEGLPSERLRLMPATVYGYAAEPFEAPLTPVP